MRRSHLAVTLALVLLTSLAALPLAAAAPAAEVVTSASMTSNAAECVPNLDLSAALAEAPQRTIAAPGSAMDAELASLFDIGTTDNACLCACSYGQCQCASNCNWSTCASCCAGGGC